MELNFFFFTTLYTASRTWFSRGTLFKPESRNAALTQRFPLVRMSPPGRISCTFLIRLMVSSSNLASKAFANRLSQSHNYTRTLASIPFLKLFFFVDKNPCIFSQRRHFLGLHRHGSQGFLVQFVVYHAVHVTSWSQAHSLFLGYPLRLFVFFQGNVVLFLLGVA